MIIGAVDVGTNSVKLLVARLDGRRFRPLAQRVVITRLGAGLGHRGRISLEAADRTLDALADFKKLCDDLGCRRIVAVGTQALRAASNAREFVTRCEYEAGIALRVVTGDEEARLSFLGATADWPGRPLAALDIGGGSTEYVVGRDGKPAKLLSLKLGAVALSERYLASDPPTPAELAAARAKVRRAVLQVRRRLGAAARDVVDLVAIGGTAVTTASILAARTGSRRLHGMVVQHPDVGALLGDLAAMPLARRRRVRGLEPERADIILAGLLILDETLSVLAVPAMRVSLHGLRRGLVLQAAR